MPSADDYREDYSQLRARMDRVARHSSATMDTTQARETCAELERFAHRWQKHFAQPEFHAVLRSLRDWSKQVQAHLAAARDLHLLQLLAARNECAITRMMFDFGCAFTKTLQETPPEQRPALEAIYREEMGQPYHAETDFRETEALLDSAEVRFTQAWAAFQAQFPEDAPAALHQKLLAAGPDEIKAWQAQLTARRTPPAAR